MPPKLLNAPSLHLGLELYYTAFWRLDSCRQVGMGEGPISWTDVESYGRAKGFDDEQRDDLHHHIRAMDGEYRKWLAAERKRNGGKAQSAPVQRKNAQTSKGRRGKQR